MKVKTLAAKLVGVVVAVFLAVFLTQCGGGGGGTTGDNTQPQTLSGTVAVGKPLANTPVYLKDKNGQVRSTLTDANGRFSFDTTGLTPPFYLRTQGMAFFLTLTSNLGQLTLHHLLQQLWLLQTMAMQTYTLYHLTN
jgi:hypothetical protein